jgi:phasin
VRVVAGEIQMSNENMWNFDVPAQMRQLAEQSVEQARKAVDGFITAAQKTAETVENQAHTAQSGAKDVGRKAMAYAEQNITNSFEFAQKLVRAKDMQEIMALQAEFVQSQMQAMGEQAKDMATTAQKSAMDAAKPKF